MSAITRQEAIEIIEHALASIKIAEDELAYVADELQSTNWYTVGKLDQARVLVANWLTTERLAEDENDRDEAAFEAMEDGWLEEFEALQTKEEL